MSIETTASNLYYYFKFLTSAYKYGGIHATKQIRFFVGLASHGKILSEAPSAISAFFFKKWQVKFIVKNKYLGHVESGECNPFSAVRYSDENWKQDIKRMFS